MGAIDIKGVGTGIKIWIRIGIEIGIGENLGIHPLGIHSREARKVRKLTGKSSIIKPVMLR